jgi:16S rRNA (guanine1516-N2)-methyltransferase
LTGGEIRLMLLAGGPADEHRVTNLAQRLGYPVLATGSLPEERAASDLLLIASGSRLCLQQGGAGAPGPVAVDFADSAMRHRRRSGGNELLGRAVGVGRQVPLRVLDATAGLGRDAWVLADLGCEVLLCERHPVVAVMLEAGLELARSQDDSALAGTAARMRLFEGDARDLDAAEAFDVIYLDPMFPARNKSAAVKKGMALFQRLLEDAARDDGSELLGWALGQDVARAVVKRPLKALPLAGREPSHCIRGKAVRYDVYVRRKLG